jgi:hypothetical protein
VPVGLQPGVFSTMFCESKVGEPEQSRAELAPVFPARIEPEMSKVPPLREMPPPLELFDWLAVTVTPSNVAAPALLMPPPSLAMLPSNVLFDATRLPCF